MGHTGFEDVWNKDLGHATKGLEDENMGSNPEREFLGRGGLGKGLAADAKGGDKDLNLSDFSGDGIDSGNGLPALADKERLFDYSALKVSESPGILIHLRLKHLLDLFGYLP